MSPAEFEAATGDLKQRFDSDTKVALAQLIPRPIAFLGGGAPITRRNVVIGAIGASGASEDQDAACVNAALSAVRALLEETERD
jgi:uncharacterized protein GlcG (DUF336 family)